MTSCTAFRHAFYETFWHIHVVLVSLILAALDRHLAGTPIQNMIKVIISIWVVEVAYLLPIVSPSEDCIDKYSSAFSASSRSCTVTLATMVHKPKLKSSQARLSA